MRHLRRRVQRTHQRPTRVSERRETWWPATCRRNWKQRHDADQELGIAKPPQVNLEQEVHRGRVQQPHPTQQHPSVGEDRVSPVRKDAAGGHCRRRKSRRPYCPSEAGSPVEGRPPAVAACRFDPFLVGAVVPNHLNHIAIEGRQAPAICELVPEPVQVGLWLPPKANVPEVVARSEALLCQAAPCGERVLRSKELA